MAPLRPTRNCIRPLGLALSIGLSTFVLLTVTQTASAEQSQRGHWQPRPTTKPWQLQLKGRIDTSIDVPVFEIDGVHSTHRTVRELHRLHARVICRLDLSSFRGPTHSLERLFATCERKGFDAVAPGNLAGWENRTGFGISRHARLLFYRWVANQAHGRGMAVALSNDGRLARALVDDFDFAIAEQCFQFHECGHYRPFVRHRKAVFEVEYGLKVGQYCATARKLHFSAIGKSTDLFARPWRPC
jgi:hypothetical protein